MLWPNFYAQISVLIIAMEKKEQVLSFSWTEGSNDNMASLNGWCAQTIFLIAIFLFQIPYRAFENFNIIYAIVFFE